MGSIAESRAAMRFLAMNPQWKDKHIVSVMAGFSEIMTSGELVLQPDFEAIHCIPAAILVKLNAV